MDPAYSIPQSRHAAPSDSRLLSNLIKAERNYITHLRASVNAAQGASAALSSWGTSEAPDVTEASARIGILLAVCAEVQSTHVAAIEGYRAALKDVADREGSIRTVVRDRDILVSRLIKASQKSASASSKKSPEERAEKVAKAQRELAACEQVLISEEAALVGVKRRTFKEALTMRMKTMGDAGAAMVDAAKESILLLNEFDSSAYSQMPYSPIGAYDEMQGYGDGHDPSPYQHFTTNVAHQQQDDSGAYDQMAINHPNFENNSVTPSQSASQVYQPYANRSSGLYNAPFDGIAERGAEHSQDRRQQRDGDDSDSDEEDWHQAFGGHPDGTGSGEQQMMVHQGGGAVMPAPHQLDARAGGESDFVPNMMPKLHQAKEGAAPAPTPPAKDQDKRLSHSFSMKKKKGGDASPTSAPAQRQLNYVSMPPVPTAPRLDSNGINMPSVPTAPKLYMRGTAKGAQEEASSDEGDRNTVVNRGGASNWTSRNDSAGRNGEASSDGEGTTRASQLNGAPRKGGFLGKMGRLFKGDDRRATESMVNAPEKRARRTSSQWDTLTDTNLRSNSVRVKDPTSMGRRQSALRGPLIVPENSSSDEEMVDESKLVRHVNKGPPLWQTSSDIGTGSKLTSGLSRPSLLKRTSSARVNVGPMSWKAHQQASSIDSRDPEQFKATEASSGGVSGLHRSSTLLSATPSKKKKKKKSATASKASSVEGGSEIGTQSTRVRPTATASGLPLQRSSILVTGDAASGVRRSDSLSYGSMRSGENKLGKRSSKRLSAMSTQQVHNPKSGGISAADPAGKFATSNWVAKSSGIDETEEATKQEKSAPAGVAASKDKPELPIKAPIPVRATPARDEGQEPPKHVPQPSRTMSPPLKPALKHNSIDMTRSGSVASSRAGGAPRLPVLPAPMSAPGSVLSLNRDETIDGTGSLNFPSLNEGRKQPRPNESPSAASRTALPRIDMPASEPFKIDLEGAKYKQPTTPQRERLHAGGDASPLLTPNERQAYSSYLATEGDEDMGEKGKPVAKVDVAQDSQPTGVTRTTVARASVGGGVLGPKNVPPPVLKQVQQDQGLPVKLSRSYSGDIAPLSSDSSEDEDGTPKTARPAAAHAVKKSASILSNSHLRAGPGTDAADRSPDGSGVGSTVSRRKSVRMAADVKLPPETPPITEGVGKPTTALVLPSNYKPAPRKKDQLSDRIAPPPASTRVASGHMERPIDLGAMREPTGWSTRIGMSRDDDSSDEEDAGGSGEGAGLNDYESARRNFGSISRTWSKTVGKATSGAATGASGEAKPKKKKKKQPTNESGYNPAIPLPAGMEVVGRSASKRGR